MTRRRAQCTVDVQLRQLGRGRHRRRRRARDVQVVGRGRGEEELQHRVGGEILVLSDARARSTDLLVSSFAPRAALNGWLLELLCLNTKVWIDIFIRMESIISAIPEISAIFCGDFHQETNSVIF